MSRQEMMNELAKLSDAELETAFKAVRQNFEPEASLSAQDYDAYLLRLGIAESQTETAHIKLTLSDAVLAERKEDWR
jgi:hypothetical protein